MLNIDGLLAGGYVDRLSAIICGCSLDKDKGKAPPHIRGFVDILETVYRKYGAKVRTRFACPEKLLSILEDAVFQPLSAPTEEKVDEPLRKSALELIKQVCSENPTCVRSVIARFHPLMQYVSILNLG